MIVEFNLSFIEHVAYSGLVLIILAVLFTKLIGKNTSDDNAFGEIEHKSVEEVNKDKYK